MTRDQIIDLALARCRRDAGEAPYAAYAVSELALWQTTEADAGEFLPWFTLRAAQLTVSTAGDTAPLPTDFAAFPQEGSVVFVPVVGTDEITDLVPLHRMQPGAAARGVLDPRAPTGFAISNRTVLFTPAIPDTTPVVIYHGTETASSLAYGDGGQPAANAWMVNVPDLMVAWLTHKLAAFYLRDSEIKDHAAVALAIATKRLIVKDTIEVEGARVRVINEFVAAQQNGPGANVVP